ncbi:hypothetical protein BJX63DRAFT_161304 [Aspergillus granulosus]|uniref:Uncharacterized protein n=1 Tax=Aspergillus granulosus TaxID=176169 RepID=A0ABR4HJG6_9EURO
MSHRGPYIHGPAAAGWLIWWVLGARLLGLIEDGGASDGYESCVGTPGSLRTVHTMQAKRAVLWRYPHVDGRAVSSLCLRNKNTAAALSPGVELTLTCPLSVSRAPCMPDDSYNQVLELSSKHQKMTSPSGPPSLTVARRRRPDGTAARRFQTRAGN